MARGRKRQHNPLIPAHIDQAKLPAGVYFDPTGNGRWLLRHLEDGRWKRTAIATAAARLSDLHRLVEERHGIDRDSIAFVFQQYLDSPQTAALQPKSRRNYTDARDHLVAYPTRLGPLGTLQAARTTPALWQRILDQTAIKTPTKANKAIQFAKGAFAWAIRRDVGGLKTNPCADLELATERKLRRFPASDVVTRLSTFAQKRGARAPHTPGSCSPYLWMVLELAYLLRLRGIEVVTLTDALALPEGVLTNRRKGSRDSLVAWTPRLRAVWDAAIAHRTAVWEKTRRPVPLRAEDRTVLVAEGGGPLAKSSLDTAWQRLVRAAIDAKAITPAERFSLHDMKRKGVSDTPGTRADKQLASGHRTEAMLDIYDNSVPVVKPAGE